jgi:hypothetical protein
VNKQVLILVGLLLLVAVVLAIMGSGMLSPTTNTTTTTLTGSGYVQPQINSLLVKLNRLGNDTVCYKLPQLMIPKCQNTTKVYVLMPPSETCTTINGTIYDTTPVVLMQYNNSNIWGPIFNVRYIDSSGQNVTKEMEPAFEVKDINCDKV